jgi:AcrR family transcriptional regulator
VQRARSDHAKAARLGEILDAAALLFDEFGADLTLLDVAQRTGLSRTTLYGYAATKEELLLLLTSDELRRFFSRLTTGLGTQPLDTLICDCVFGQPRLAPLLTMTPTVFERNISSDVARSWKTELADLLSDCGVAIERHHAVSPGVGARLLLHTNAVVTGLHAIAHPPMVIEQTIADANLTQLQIDFQTELRIAVAALVSALSNTPIHTPQTTLAKDPR